MQGHRRYYHAAVIRSNKNCSLHIISFDTADADAAAAGDPESLSEVWLCVCVCV